MNIKLEDLGYQYSPISSPSPNPQLLNNLMHEREKSSLYNFFKQTLSPSYFLGTFAPVKSHMSIGTLYPFSKLLAASNVQYR
ncbi:hypothetical protein H5410_026923 [Solanum commersonii]|uniref:Uncharacterized protein n=1 Tax=Solanum commersonii TaxID=4109 RepID=A0A9J5Z0H0_SOLCO|nr:hypothetical protein H5410_026923 [Solanum commersonii]